MSFLSSIFSIFTGGSTTWSLGLAGDESTGGDDIGVSDNDGTLGGGEEWGEACGEGEEGAGRLDGEVV